MTTTALPEGLSVGFFVEMQVEGAKPYYSVMIEAGIDQKICFVADNRWGSWLITARIENGQVVDLPCSRDVRGEVAAVLQERLSEQRSEMEPDFQPNTRGKR